MNNGAQITIKSIECMINLISLDVITHYLQNGLIDEFITYNDVKHLVSLKYFNGKKIK